MTNNLSNLEALALAATPGEWVIDRDEICYRSTEDDQSYGMLLEVMLGDQSNAAFIAAANPKTVIELIEVMEMMAEALQYFAFSSHGEIYDNGSAVANKALARYEALKEGKK